VGVDDGRGLRWLTVGVKDALVKWPFLWFFMNLLWLFLVGFALRTLMAYLIKQALGAKSLRKTVNRFVVGACAPLFTQLCVLSRCFGTFNRKLNQDALATFLESRTFETQDASVDTQTSLKQFVWEEEDTVYWEGVPPKASILIDESYGFLLSSLINVREWNGVVGAYVACVLTRFSLLSQWNANKSEIKEPDALWAKFEAMLDKAGCFTIEEECDAQSVH